MPEFIINGIDYVIEDSGTTVGRGMDADVPIASQGLSRVHARFTSEKKGIFIEDLNSKNGTFVNGKKIQEKTRLSPNDKLKIADLPCTIRFPAGYDSAPQKKAPASPETAQPETALPKAQPSQGAARPEGSFFLEVFSKAVFPAAVVIVLGLAYMVFGSGDSAVKTAAREHIQKAMTILEWTRVSEDIPLNREFLKKLSSVREQLVLIPESLKTEYAQASDLIEKIDEVCKAIEQKEMSVPTAQDGLLRYETVLNEFKEGILTRDEAVSKLRTLAAVFPGSEAGIKAAADAERLERELREKEEKSYQTALDSIKSKAQTGDYKGAVAAAQQAAGVKYETISSEKTDEFTRLEKEILAHAETELKKEVDAVIARAEGGRYDELKGEIRKAFDAVGIPSLSKIRDDGINKLEGVRQEELEQRKKDIAERLKACDELEEEKYFKDALERYDIILQGVTFEDIKKDIVKRKELCELRDMAKTFIMEYVNDKKNVEIPVLGTAVEMKEKEIFIDFEGQTMGVPWKRLQKSDMLVLMEKALEVRPFKKMYLPYSVLLDDAGKSDEAKEYREKAFEALPGLKKQYPTVF